MQIIDILNRSASFQSRSWYPITKELTIGEALHEIKSNKYAVKINQLRELIKNGDIDGYNNHKKNLPAITFCGTFEGRRKKENLKTYNNVIVLDIDKLSDEDLIRTKGILEEDNSVFSLWISPSNRGLKGLVYIKYDFEIEKYDLDLIHKSAFKKVSNYFEEKHQISLDESGSDTTRLCFFSFDPKIIIKEDVEPFVIFTSDLIQISQKELPSKKNKLITSGRKDLLYNPDKKNSPKDRKTLQAILKFLIKRNLSITYKFENWLQVAYAISNTFTYDLGEKYFLSLSQLDKDKYNELDCKNMLSYCYENSSNKVKFKTIVYLANQLGYKTNIQKKGSTEGGR